MLIGIKTLFTENHLPEPRWCCSQTCLTCCATFLLWAIFRCIDSTLWTTVSVALCVKDWQTPWCTHPSDRCTPLQSCSNVLICLGITQREQLSAVSPRKTAEWRGGRATVENKNMIYTEFLFNHVNVSSTVCCPGFQIPAYSYHLVNRKVCANKNKSFLCCSGPPLHNSGLCSCSVPWKTNSAVQLGSSRQQKGNFNPLPPFFFSFGTTQIYLVIKSGKAPHHLKRIGKWEGKLCQIPLTCRLGNTTGQEMNPPIGQSAWRAEESNYLR